MKSKKIEHLVEKQRELKRLSRKVRMISKSIDDIIDRHNSYRVGGPDKVVEWFESFPIETLKESLNYDHGISPDKLSLQDLETKGKLRKSHYAKEDQLELAEHKRTEAEIDVLLERINRLL